MKKIIWVQRLGTFTAISLFLKGIFAGLQVKYEASQVSRAGESLLRILRVLGLGRNFSAFNLEGDKKDSSDCTLFYKIFKDMEVFIEKFNKNYLADEPEWFRRMTAAYLLDWKSSPFNFITLVEHKILEMPDHMHEVYISAYPISPLILKLHASPADFAIKVIFSPKERLKPFIVPLYLAFHACLQWMVGLPIRTNIDKARPAIWVEYEGAHSYLSFWREHLKAEDFDQVYYLDRPDTPLTEDAKSVSGRDGFKWIDCRKIYRAPLKFADIKEIFKALFKYDAKYPAWLNFFKMHFAILYRIYYRWYEHFKVKIIIQHHDTSWLPQVQAMAVEAAGGIMVGFHWSCLQVPQVFMLTPEHVYFVWGKHMYEFMQTKGNTCRYILPCGLWLRENATEKGKIIFTPEVKFVMAIFDGSTSPVMYHTPAALSEFYIRILDLLERNNVWGGIVKSKNSKLDDLLYLPQGASIVSRMKKLIETKRLVFLDPEYSPLAASKFADISVTYGFHTAGVLVGVHGYPTLTWDVAGWLKQPLRKDKAQRFIYDSLEDLENAIYRFYNGDRSVGDFSLWREKFNYFNDWNAHKRVGGFLKTFMDSAARYDKMERALSYAVSLYFKENTISEDFFSMTDLWKE